MSGSIRDSAGMRRIVSGEDVWTGRLFGMRTETVDLGNGGSPVVREFMDHPGAVAIVALDGEGRVCLIRQYRHPVRATLWEIPAGLLDSPDEPLFEVGRRELAEEVDLGARRWDVLADFYASSGCTNERVRVYLARDLFESEAAGFVREDEEAELEIAWVPLEEAVCAVLQGRMHSPAATVGVLAAAAARARGWADLRPADTPWMGAAEVT